MIEVLLLCAAAVEVIAAEGAVRDLPRRFDACVDVGELAAAGGADVELAIAVCVEESRCNPDVVSRAGARGALQVIPRWWCPGGAAEGCDFEAEGVRALSHYVTRYGLRRGLCAYNAGNVCRPSWRRANPERAERLKARLERARGYIERVIDWRRKIRRRVRRRS